MHKPTTGLQVSRSLTAKLIIAISVLVLMGGSIYLFTLVKTEKKNSMTDALSFISLLSEMMKNSVRQDMLTANREEIQKTIEAITASESIKSAKILDHNGQVIYSTLKPEIGQIEANDSPHCLGCHENQANPIETIPGRRRWNIYTTNDQHRVLSYVEPIYNEPACHTTPCHAHPESQKVLGILLTDFALDQIDHRIDNAIITTLLYGLVFLTIISGMLSYILWQIILRPVAKLSSGMQKLSSGQLPPKIRIESQDEIGMLARTFNLMLDELQTARQKMANWTQSLEEELKKKTNQITQAQDKLIQTEKMAALGRLTAIIAHEIKNPLAALGGFGRRLKKSNSLDRHKLYADIIVNESDRLERVLNDILTFSRESRFHFQRQSITETVNHTLQLFAELCQDHDISVVADLNVNLPVMLADDQLKQALNNLLSNALYAMADGGTLTVTTKLEKVNDIEYVALHISDTGPGIPEDKLALIFEPFFTTKKLGQGTGLGLSISKKIIEEHGGFITAKNLENGLIISIFLPHQHKKIETGTPCWEYMQCGRDREGKTTCRAYPHFGRICWVVAGTLCEGKIQGTYAQKHQDCRNCGFYKKIHEGNSPETEQEQEPFFKWRPAT